MLRFLLRIYIFINDKDKLWSSTIIVNFRGYFSKLLNFISIWQHQLHFEVSIEPLECRNYLLIRRYLTSDAIDVTHIGWSLKANICSELIFATRQLPMSIKVCKPRARIHQTKFLHIHAIAIHQINISCS